MNRKLITLVVTVLLALAITAPALAEVVVFNWEEEYPAENPCEKKGEIWLNIRHHWQVGYEYDENGELVEIIYQMISHWHLYNKSHPELFIDGLTGGTGHFTEKKGSWGTGLSINFHAPGYPQLGHFSGYWTFDEYWNPIFDHGRLEDVNFDVFCELLTP